MSAPKVNAERHEAYAMAPMYASGLKRSYTCPVKSPMK